MGTSHPAAKKILLLAAVIIAAIIAAYYSYYRRSNIAPLYSPSMNIPASWKIFNSSIEVDVYHPADYSVQEREYDKNVKILTLVGRGNEKRVAIFKQSDFTNSRPVWVFPEFSAKSHQYLPIDPQEELVKGPSNNLYGVWLFYEPDDAAAKQELHQIIDTLRFK